MRFTTYAPCDILEPYVKAFAVSETDEEQTYRVLPDTGLVMGFQYRGKLVHIDNGIPAQLSASGITGLLDRCRIFQNSPGTGTFLVYFTEAGAATFFRQPLHELFRESVSLDDMIHGPALRQAEALLYAATTDRERVTVVEEFLLSAMRQTMPDLLVLAAVRQIRDSKGTLRITDLARELSISKGPFEKRFRQVVGASPKKFASIIRFRHIIQNYSPVYSLTELGYQAGFYDQAHFIKEFKNFTGQTPEISFQKNKKTFFYNPDFSRLTIFVYQICKE